MRVMRATFLLAALSASSLVAALRSNRATSSSSQHEGSLTSPAVSEEERKLVSELQHTCGLCDFQLDATCERCLRQEKLIVVCGDCFYTNECFAIEAGEDARHCKIVGTDP